MIKFYITYDTVSETYSMPFPAKNDNVARRNLLIASKRENLPLEDIRLFCLGIYNSDTGNFDSFSEREQIFLTEDSKE